MLRLELDSGRPQRATQTSSDSNVCMDLGFGGYTYSRLNVVQYRVRICFT